MTECPKNALPTGHVIDKYRIEDVLGSGGFGIVYRARHQELGDVAIKEYLPPHTAVRDGTEVHPIDSQSRQNYDEGLRRFLEEAKRLVQFNHPNIVRCRDFFRANGTAYLVMDYEDGLPLSELLRRREEQGNPLSGDEIKKIILPLLDGLSVVHSHDVLHRDIKPNNIFIRRSTEQPVLIDFGAAKQGFSEHSKSVWAYTQGYAPPEQVEQDGKLGPWTDIYAIGAVMWRIVASDNPLKAEDRAIAQARGNLDPMKPAVDLGEGRYPTAMLQAIDKCLSLQEKDRYQSVADLGQVLLEEKHHTPQQEKLVDAPNRPHWLSTRKVIAATAGVVAIAALAALLTTYNRMSSLDITHSASDVGAGNVSDIEALHISAEQGDAKAQNNLGSAYYNGQNVQQDYGEAVKWWRRAGWQGVAEAQNSLGNAYYNGEGVPKNYAGAVQWWRQAAKQGHAEAQFSLGRAYAKGEWVPQNVTEAVRWYWLAAEQGLAQAQFALGSAYILMQNHDEAAKWYRFAAEQGYAQGQFGLGYAYSLGLGVPQDHSEAVRWYRLAAEQGLDEGQFLLGYAYANGEGVKQDYGEAVRWYRLAAEQGHSRAQYRLGTAYYSGNGVMLDHGEAVWWFRLAAEQGLAHAQYKLGDAYERGEGVRQNYGEAVRWFQLAANQGNVRAQHRLGVAYYSGKGVSLDYGEAVRWMRLAAEQGHVEAQFGLGLAYFAGNGVPLNYFEACIWLSLSVMGGFDQAANLWESAANKLSIDELTSVQHEVMRRFEAISK